MAANIFNWSGVNAAPATTKRISFNSPTTLKRQGPTSFSAIVITLQLSQKRHGRNTAGAKYISLQKQRHTIRWWRLCYFFFFSRDCLPIPPQHVYQTEYNSLSSLVHQPVCIWATYYRRTSRWNCGLICYQADCVVIYTSLLEIDLFMQPGDYHLNPFILSIKGDVGLLRG